MLQILQDDLHCFDPKKNEANEYELVLTLLPWAAEFVFPACNHRFVMKGLSQLKILNI